MKSNPQFSVFTSQYIKPYSTVAGIYLLALVVLKGVEWFLLGIEAPNWGQILVNAVVYNLVVASWTVLAVGLLYAPGGFGVGGLMLWSPADGRDGPASLSDA